MIKISAKDRLISAIETAAESNNTFVEVFITSRDIDQHLQIGRSFAHPYDFEIKNHEDGVARSRFHLRDGSIDGAITIGTVISK